MREYSIMKQLSYRTGSVTMFATLFISFSRAIADDFPTTPNTSTTTNDQSGFSQEAGLSANDKAISERDRAEIGGRVRIEGVYTQTTKQKPADANMKNGSGAELYLDAKSESGVRSFLRIRMEQSAAGVSATSATSAAGTDASTSPSLSVDEAKIQATLWHKLFLTAGRQKMKFGAAKFFNPTDFPNQQMRDPFAREDRRPGVDALKLHLPLEDMNIYAIALASKSEVFGDTAGYGRAEFAFSGGEVSVSALSKRNQTTKYGIDASAAVRDIDAYTEVAFDDHERYSAGFTYDVQISDSDAISLGAEYHHNGNGLAGSSQYFGALASGTHTPLTLGRDYAAATIYLAKPQWLKHSTLIFSTIANTADNSATLVPQIFHEITPEITASAQLMMPAGKSDGEFRMMNVLTQATLALEAIF